MTRFIFIFCLACAALAQDPSKAAASPANDAMAAARKLHNDGKFDEAIAAFAKVAKADPNNWGAHMGIGNALDLKGDYAEGRKHFSEAEAVADADSKPNVWRAMAMSYGFTRDAKNAEKYGKQVYDYRMTKNDLESAAEAANELARVLLESGDIDGAERWYKTGYDTIRKKELTPKEKELWEFRWHSAQSRIAARRGQKDAAKQHADAGKAEIDKGTNPDQAPYVPYVYGYAAFYAGDYKAAIEQFLKTNQNDPFNQVMLAQAYEKTGDKAKAREYYEKVLKATGHNPTNAYARPIAKEKVKQ